MGRLTNQTFAKPNEFLEYVVRSDGQHWVMGPQQLHSEHGVRRPHDALSVSHRGHRRCFLNNSRGKSKYSSNLRNATFSYCYSCFRTGDNVERKLSVKKISLQVLRYCDIQRRSITNFFNVIGRTGKVRTDHIHYNIRMQQLLSSVLVVCLYIGCLLVETQELAEFLKAPMLRRDNRRDGHLHLRRPQ